MSETKSKPLSLKGIAAIAGAGILALIAHFTGIDLTGGSGKGSAPTGSETQQQGTAGGGQSKTPASGSIETPKAPSPEPESKKKSEGGYKYADAPKAEGEAESATKTPAEPLRDDTALIAQLARTMRSDVQVEAEGEIVLLFNDDTVGSQHQLFLVELKKGLTVKISHNIDIAPRVPVKKGDRIRFHGEYEWNEKGGVVHWTHRTLRGGSHPGGWLLHNGKKYE